MTFTFRKFGRVVNVLSSGSPTTAVKTNAYVGSVTLASAYRPVASYITYTLVSADKSVQVNISTAGVFQYGYSSEELATSSVLRASFTYIAAS